MSFKKGFRRFWDDLLTPKLVLLKIIFFFLLGGIVILWPQFTLHQEAIGLTKYQTGIVGSVLSAVTIVVPLLAGVAGDKLGNYKVILSISTVTAGVGAFLFTVVPRAEAATFWVYMIVRVSFGAFQSFSFTLYEGVIMAYGQEYNVDYGFQRAWGTLAVFISSLLGGYITEATEGFSMIFYLSTGIHIVAGGLMMFLNVEFKMPAQSLSKQIFKHLANAEVLMFLGAMLAVGMFIGYIETFMYRYLSDLGASPFLISLTVTVGAPLELPFTLVSSSLVAKASASCLTRGGHWLWKHSRASRMDSRSPQESCTALSSSPWRPSLLPED
ncbi:major facilitator superfamily domain-containing protein 9-like isoform X2 [Penaeus chinensis]|uniref:major facilitator superfamily domain-containing protein 9-like isoform X2 n=1 Tax=Penaeus chinensis TaxID=139456 RepID=UPI001FB76D61|nr:major facilitator superfamily domain-containing protein 9-like isoform X2 [Penaeus chinensis]